MRKIVRVSAIGASAIVLLLLLTSPQVSATQMTFTWSTSGSYEFNPGGDLFDGSMSWYGQKTVIIDTTTGQVVFNQMYARLTLNPPEHWGGCVNGFVYIISASEELLASGYIDGLDYQEPSTTRTISSTNSAAVKFRWWGCYWPGLSGSYDDYYVFWEP